MAPDKPPQNDSLARLVFSNLIPSISNAVVDSLKITPWAFLRSLDASIERELHPDQSRGSRQRGPNLFLALATRPAYTVFRDASLGPRRYGVIPSAMRVGLLRHERTGCREIALVTIWFASIIASIALVPTGPGIASTAIGLSSGQHQNG